MNPPLTGAILRSARISHGISLSALANEIGISKGYLSRVENDTLSAPSVVAKAMSFLKATPEGRQWDAFEKVIKEARHSSPLYSEPPSKYHWPSTRRSLTAVEGPHKARSVVSSLLDSLGNPSRHPLRLAFDPESPLLDEPWMIARLLVALEAGHSVAVLVNINSLDSSIKSAQIVSLFLPLLCYSDFELFWQEAGAPRGVGQDYIVVPDKGCATYYWGANESVVCLTQRDACQVVLSHVEDIFSRGNRMVKFVAAGDPHIENAFLETDLVEGDRWIAKKEPSVVFMDNLTLKEQLADVLNSVRAPEALALIDARSERMQAFRRHLSNNKSVDLHSLSTMRAIAHKGYFERWTFLPLNSRETILTPTQRKRLFQSIINALDHPNFDIALVDETEFDESTTLLMLKGNQGWLQVMQEDRVHFYLRILAKPLLDGLYDYLKSIYVRTPLRGSKAKRELESLILAVDQLPAK